MTTIKIVDEKRAEPISQRIDSLSPGTQFKFGHEAGQQGIAMESTLRPEYDDKDTPSVPWRSPGTNLVSWSAGDNLVYPCHPDGTLIEPAAVEKVRADSIGIGRMFSREKDNEDFIYLVAAMVSDYVHSLLFADGCNAACIALTPSADLVTPVTITKIHYRKGAE